jgi:ABC-type bacteriocin/lantibiotic exporter with double-glycine peptidase domain
MEIYYKLLSLLNRSEKIIFYKLLTLMLIVAILDTVGVASVMPFVAIVSDSNLIESSVFLSGLYKMVGLADKKEFIFAIGISVFILLVITLSLRAFTIYAQLRFSLNREYSISLRLFEGYLNQRYSWFLNNNSSDLGSKILSDVGNLIHTCITPLLTMISQGAVSILIISLLVFVDPTLAFTVGIVLCLSYFIFYCSTSNFMARIGVEKHEANHKRYQIISEAFGAVKELKLARLEKTYISGFAKPAEIYAKHTASAQAISQLPRFALEAIAFGGMIIVVLFLMKKNSGLVSALPIISLYAFAGYRLMPALQHVYGAFVQIRFANKTLEVLHQDLKNLTNLELNEVESEITFEKCIRLQEVEFTYPNASLPAIKRVSLTIPINNIIGLVGVSGSGKTTIVDILLGLFEPQHGSIYIDDALIDRKNIKSWQNLIGYVPQNIYLSDSSIASNIAFGTDVSKINYNEVIKAAIVANLNEFILNDLPHGYDTIVGERGVRLSGGQRQRIGIARALYRKPKILVLDEATSALDNITEQNVMDAVHNIGRNITIIIVAHRLSTISECDIIFQFKDGCLVGKGSMKELINSNTSFKELSLYK